MMSRRDIHVMKSPEEYRDYLDSTIRISNTTAAPSLERGEATNDPILHEEAMPLGDTTPPRQESWFQTHKQTIIRGVIVAVVVGLIGWYGSTLFSLNREVGIASATSAALEKNQSSLAETLRHLEDRLVREIGALTSRIDRIVDARVIGPGAGDGG